MSTSLTGVKGRERWQWRRQLADYNYNNKTGQQQLQCKVEWRRCLLFVIVIVVAAASVSCCSNWLKRIAICD